MFALTDADLKGPILGCADGPASFNARRRREGVEFTLDRSAVFATNERQRDRVTCVLVGGMASRLPEMIDMREWQAIRYCCGGDNRRTDSPLG